MNKLQAMEVFVQVVDTGSFTRTAEQMQLPKATVSTLISALENDLAAKLLHRTTRHVSVTSDGAVYYERCLRILGDVRDAEEALSRNRASPSGRLRIDVATGVANDILIPALPDFFARYPDVMLELGCGDRTVDLVEEGIDCAIRGGALPDSNLIARRVGVLHFVTAATPAYIARHGRPLHPRELSEHVCVNYFSSKTGKVLGWDFVRGDEELLIDLPGSLAVNDSTAYMNAGLAGLGIIQMASYAVTPHLAQGTLELLLEDWTSSPLPVHVVYPQNRHLSAKVRVFVEWVADLFLSHPGFELKSPVRQAA
ncbi:LysR substrate-binding domain-containing protein [Massilia sp. DWR3-1-1]|uniref:LysR substrate-binding domain-containing protein n=1 Tax=Massilia sp. DWR3-1-1 TaxID=2804559 RepID=UPI003CE90460